MSAKKPNISQIDQYLKGKLDARAMHKLERQAQDDPFLMDALEGFEKAGNDQQANLTDLKDKLAQRTVPAKERSIILWRVLPLAASVLVMLGLGYWYFKPAPDKQQYANVIPVGKPQPQATISQPNKTPATEQKSVTDNLITANESMILNPPVVDNQDTVAYIANNYKVKPNASINEVLKKMDGMEVSPDGSLTFQGEAVAKVKLNGKTFSGGSAEQAIQNLPADIVDKIQVVDDYGDQAARTGVRDGNPTKTLNITTDTLDRKKLLAKNAPAPTLKEITIANPTVIENKLAGRVAGIAVTNNVNTRPVIGTVLDNKGNPLIGATIQVAGANNAVNTDTKGNFKIDMPANKDLLAVNYVGYNPKQVQVGEQKDLKISLEENSSSLNDVVVSGYGIAKKQGKAKSTGCNENLKFKKKFFDNIRTVENYTNEQIAGIKHTITEKTYKAAVELLAKYIKVSTSSYTNMAALQADKQQWLNWYEANKCNNLK